MRERFDLLSQQSLMLRHTSKEYVFRNVLHMSEDEINAITTNRKRGEEDEMR